jgi:UDP:flavonoid glycosyltransferase YjiC (YdhE family)
VEIGHLTAERLSELIQRVQKNPSYRDRARYFQKVIAQTQGLDLAADVIERAFKKNQIVDSAGERAGEMLKAEHKL